MPARLEDPSLYADLKKINMKTGSVYIIWKPYLAIAGV